MARSEKSLTAVFTDTANAIRAKKESVEEISPLDFADEVASIETGITPTGTKVIYGLELTHDVTEYAKVDLQQFGHSRLFNDDEELGQNDDAIVTPLKSGDTDTIPTKISSPFGTEETINGQRTLVFSFPLRFTGNEMKFVLDSYAVPSTIEEEEKMLDRLGFGGTYRVFSMGGVENTTWQDAYDYLSVHYPGGIKIGSRTFQGDDEEHIEIYVASGS